MNTPTPNAPTPHLFSRLCDDAAVFPPGRKPLTDAIPDHGQHRAAPYAAVVGSFVLAAADLDQLAQLTQGASPGTLGLSLTTPRPAAVADALAKANQIPAVDIVGLEVAVPEGVEPTSVVPTLRTAVGERELPTYVELPRDGRRDPLLDQLTGTGCRAKMRCGGIRADLYPSAEELASTVHATVHAGIPFKATAGLHHALRNTDPDTGFEQHGFLNLMQAAAAATDGATTTDLVELLEVRDPERVVTGTKNLDPKVRETFHSFGTCSVAEPVAELVDLGLMSTDHLTQDLMEAPS